MSELEPGVRALLSQLYPTLEERASLQALIMQTPDAAPDGVKLQRLEDGEWLCDGGDGRSHRQGRGKHPAEAVAAWLIGMAARRL